MQSSAQNRRFVPLFKAITAMLALGAMSQMSLAQTIPDSIQRPQLLSQTQNKATPKTSPTPLQPETKEAAKSGTPLTSAQQSQLKLAQDLLRKKQYAQARLQFEELISANFNHPEAHFGLGLTLFALNDLRGANFEFTQFAQLAPERFEGPYNLGVVATRDGRYDAALKFYTDAVAKSQNAQPAIRQQILKALANEQSRAKNYTGLASSYGELLKLSNKADHKYQYAQALYLAQKYTEALPATYAALNAAPRNVEARLLLADVYVAQNLADRAIRELDAGVLQMPTGFSRSKLLFKKADILAELGRKQLALTAAKDARIADSRNAAAYAKEGELYLATKDRKSALAAFQKAVRIEPKNPAFVAELAALYLAIGNYKNANLHAAKVAGLKPDQPTLARAQYVQGVAAYRQRQYEQAKKLLSASTLIEATADSTFWLGLANYALKDYTNAAVALTQSVKLNPSTIARQNLASALLASAKYAEAENLLQQLVNENAKNADGWYLLGLAQRSQLREDDARQSLKTAAALGNSRAKEALK